MKELCRARMSNKKEESNATSQRIASLSKDPDNSPSSRSSTSSWYFILFQNPNKCLYPIENFQFIMIFSLQGRRTGFIKYGYIYWTHGFGNIYIEMFFRI